MKCDELEPLVFSLNDLAYVDEIMVKKNFDNPHDHAVYKATEVDAAIDELKQFAEDACLERDDNQTAIDELQEEIESLKATHYAEMVDAGMRERRLRRALWLKRADDAKHLVIAYENYDYLDCQEMTIKQENARTWMTCKLRTAEEWVKVWKNVERKCRAKADKFK